MRSTGLRLTSAAVALLLAGCAQMPHNNVLVFGTETKVALDVASEMTAGGAPAVTVGYKRKEAVWMPLSFNRIECGRPIRPENCTLASDDQTLYQGESSGISSGKGGSDRELDAYSVFASFGAKFKSTASGDSGVSAGGGLAQFFATGVAAQRLGANPRVAGALAVKPAVAEQVDKAEAEASEAEARADEFQQRLQNVLGVEELERQNELGAQQFQKANLEAGLIVACARPDDDKEAAALFIEASKSQVASPTAEFLDGLKGKSADTWRERLQENDAARDAAFSQYLASCRPSTTRS